MSNNRVMSVSEAVHKVQLALFEGIQYDTQLFAAGSLMSRSDYEDIVTERSISKLCGYPLCSNALPLKRPWKGHYRISLKEHKVYDLHETCMYCCSACLISSRAFSGCLKDHRCSVMNPAKLIEILRLFKNLGLEEEEEMGEGGDLGVSKLRVEEKTEVRGGEVSMEEWAGPSHAIEGYVPKRDRKPKPSSSDAAKKGSEPGDAKLSKKNDTVQRKVDFKVDAVPKEDMVGRGKAPAKEKKSKANGSKSSKSLLSETDFTSTLITSDECTVSKKLDDNSKHVPSNLANKVSKPKNSGSSKEKAPLFSGTDSMSTIIKQDEYGISKAVITSDEYSISKKLHGDTKPMPCNLANKGSKPKKSPSKGKDPFFSGMDFMSTIITQDEYRISKLDPSELLSQTNQIPREFAEKLGLGDSQKPEKFHESYGPAENDLQSSMNSTVMGTGSTSNESSDRDNVSSHSLGDASSSTIHVKKESHSEETAQSSQTTVKSSLRTSRAGKEARSVTWADEKNNDPDEGNLCQVREFQNTREAPWMVSGEEMVDYDDPQRFASAEACAMALTEAAEAIASGKSDVADAVSQAGITVLPQLQQADDVEDDALEENDAPKWPKKPGNLNSDYTDSNDSWFEAPPEGFSLTLSPFATMWNALFSWMTSSSLAFIYGGDENSHEEYLSVSGREYPGKVVLPDGRSSEIKQTVAGCLARALPGVITALKLPTPLSTLEQGLACLLETLSFMEALPPFRLKQWQVIVLLFIDALSICRIPGLTPHLSSRRILIPKVLDGAKISSEDYEIMKDLVIPLGRVPQFSMQSGG